MNETVSEINEIKERKGVEREGERARVGVSSDMVKKKKSGEVLNCSERE